MKPAIIYLRYAPRRIRKTISLDTQLYHCMRFCTAHRYEAVQTFCDDVRLYARKASPRPGYHAAVKAACDQKALLLTYNLSRVVSGIADLIKLIEQLIEHGASFASAKEDINTDSMIGQHFLETIKSLTTIGNDIRGEHASARFLQHPEKTKRRCVSYGMTRDSNTDEVIECPWEQNNIAFILECHKQKCTIQQIKTALKKKGVRYRRGRHWSKLSIQNVINRAAQRDYFEGKGPIPLAMKAVIPRSDAGSVYPDSVVPGLPPGKARAVEASFEELRGYGRRP